MSDFAFPAPEEPARDLAACVTALSSAGLDALPLPMYAADRKGVLRWLNRDCAELVGADALGRPLSSIVAEESLTLVRHNFALELLGEASATRYAVSLRDAHGRRVAAELASVAVRCEGEGVVGVLGAVCVARPVESAPVEPAERPALTPRQEDVLRLLGEGLSTTAIAAQLRIADDTARNHIRAVLRELGAHSRLEAVVKALRHGWL